MLAHCFNYLIPRLLILIARKVMVISIPMKLIIETPINKEIGMIASTTIIFGLSTGVWLSDQKNDLINSVILNIFKAFHSTWKST